MAARDSGKHPPAPESPALPLEEFVSLARRYRSEYEWVARIAEFAEDIARRQSDADKSERRKQMAEDAIAQLETQAATLRTQSERDVEAARTTVSQDLARQQTMLQQQEDQALVSLNLIRSQTVEAEKALEDAQDQLKAFRASAKTEMDLLAARVEELKKTEQAIRDRLASALR